MVDGLIVVDNDQLMVNDGQWWRVMMDDGQWWLVMVGNGRWWLMMVDNDESWRPSSMMLGDGFMMVSNWLLLVKWIRVDNWHSNKWSFGCVQLQNLQTVMFYHWEKLANILHQTPICSLVMTLTWIAVLWSVQICKNRGIIQHNGAPNVEIQRTTGMISTATAVGRAKAGLRLGVESVMDSWGMQGGYRFGRFGKLGAAWP